MSKGQSSLLILFQLHRLNQPAQNPTAAALMRPRSGHWTSAQDSDTVKPHCDE